MQTARRVGEGIGILIAALGWLYWLIYFLVRCLSTIDSRVRYRPQLRRLLCDCRRQ